MFQLTRRPVIHTGRFRFLEEERSAWLRSPFRGKRARSATPRRSRPSGRRSGSCLGRASRTCFVPWKQEKLPGAVVLREGLEDRAENYTRFLVVAREPAPLDRGEGGARKTSLVFTLPNVPGSLHRALGVFAARQLDLTKIESRPLPGRAWEYAFYLDVVGDPRAGVAEALAELRGLARELRILGAYPGSDIPVAKG